MYGTISRYTLKDPSKLVTFSIFETREGVQESTRRAAEFVRNDPLKDQRQTPEIIEGELIVSKEAAVGAH